MSLEIDGVIITEETKKMPKSLVIQNFDIAMDDLVMDWFSYGKLAGRPTCGSAGIVSMSRTPTEYIFVVSVYTKYIDTDDILIPVTLDLSGITIDKIYEPDEHGNVYVDYHCVVKVTR